MQVYRANLNGVHFENFNGENVIVNLNLGNYYSVRNCAAWIWDALQVGVTEAGLIDDLVNFYQLERELISQDLGRFLSALRDEQLIIETNAADLSSLEIGKLPRHYLAPELEIFNDLQELFLLDPVHAVDGTMGWPFQPDTPR
jgi:hypothetical protein